MKSRSDSDISKAAAAAGIRAVPRPPEPAARIRARRASALAERVASGAPARRARDSTVERDSAFERSISTTRPAACAIDLSLNVVSHGKLTWRTPRLAARRQRS